jgi:hypothetical protein
VASREALVGPQAITGYVRRWQLSLLGGTRPKYLLSGLMICAECGRRYIIQRHRANVRHYGCAVHYDRGPTVCPNGKLVQQEVLEQKVLDGLAPLWWTPYLAGLLNLEDEGLVARVGPGRGDFVFTKHRWCPGGQLKLRRRHDPTR